MKAFLASLAFIALAAPAGAAPLLRSHPSAAVTTLHLGETVLFNGAIAYRPATARAGPLPLIVLLHGASGYPIGFLQDMEPIADRRGLILLYPHSIGQTWDFILNMSMDGEPWRGRDSQLLDQSLTDLFSRAAIDRRRIVLLGFSDGAGYALSLGTANPQLFSGVVALSPGIFLPPDRSDRRQRVFVAHGRSDHILSFDNTSQTIVPELRGLGVDVRFRPFDGDHEIKSEVLNEALDFALGLQPPPLPPT